MTSCQTASGNFCQNDKNWNGVGYNAVVSFDGTDYFVFHGYEFFDQGGWPFIKKNTY